MIMIMMMMLIMIITMLEMTIIMIVIFRMKVMIIMIRMACKIDSLYIIIIIVKTHDPDEILNLIELIVGVAVMCEDKATFIQHIFDLDDISQVVLKELIEQVLHRVVDINDDNNDGNNKINDDTFVLF